MFIHTFLLLDSGGNTAILIVICHNSSKNATRALVDPHFTYS